MKTTYDLPVIGILDGCEALRRDGETVMDASVRILINEALAKCNGSQTRAATRLGMSLRCLTRACKRLGLRPIDHHRRDALRLLPASNN